MKNEKKDTVVIQAGGLGSRMRELTKDEIPKPMLCFNGKPVLQWQIENLAGYGFREFVIIIGHLGKKIQDYFEDGRRLGVHISYIQEEEPLGSAGALYFLKEMLLADRFLLIFGDVMFELDWNRMFTFHEKHQGKATLLVHPNNHPFDSDLLTMNESCQVTGLSPKNQARNGWHDNCVNAGIYILSKSVTEQMTAPQRMDLEKDVLTPLMKEQEVYGYRTPEYVRDIGTPERFWRAVSEQKSGLWKRKCLTQKQRCIFLDRDGTINKFRGLIHDAEDFELEELAGQAVKRINESGFLAVVVTNQPVVARGMCSIEEVDQIHRKMQTLLGQQGAYLDDIVFCPHHPDQGYPEEIPEYKISCKCRKPGTEMIERMAAKYHIDLSESYIIGDSTVDIQTGLNAGVKTVLTETGQAGRDGKYAVRPDYRASDLLQAVEQVLQDAESTKEAI